MDEDCLRRWFGETNDEIAEVELMEGIISMRDLAP